MGIAVDPVRCHHICSTHSAGVATTEPVHHTGSASLWQIAAPARDFLETLTLLRPTHMLSSSCAVATQKGAVAAQLSCLPTRTAFLFATTVCRATAAGLREDAETQRRKRQTQQNRVRSWSSYPFGGVPVTGVTMSPNRWAL